MTAGPFRIFRRRVGQDIRAWPTQALLLVIVLVAIGCVLWFMREAMGNERLAVRQKLADAYRGQLALVRERVEERWAHELARFDQEAPSAELFAKAAREGWADAVIFPGTYPRLDASGRNAEANAELLALEADPENLQLAETLIGRVNDYQNGGLPSAQRRFLMRELHRLHPGAHFPTLPAEDLAARYLESTPSIAIPDGLRPTSLPGVWQAASPGRKAIVLFDRENLRAWFERAVRDPSLAASVRLTVRAPDDQDTADRPLVAGDLGPQMPGWQLALSLNDQAIFDTTAERKVEAYLWIGSAVIGAMTVLTVLIARGFGRQVRLARLKNDLVANVSHELKTPLTAMRALVETLLENDRFDETTTREYLQLLAQENTRLSRLIENFLTFSRLERNKFTLNFTPQKPAAITAGAVAAMGERAVETQIADGLPEVIGDPDALVTALLNLLDNAWKYSGDHKQITLRATARNGSVVFAVEDRGLGLSPQECRHVFERFYQADHRLARPAGGCGLGLSIVRSIIEAHQGTVGVESEPGRGSIFTITLPTAAT
ncbi:MAG: HAMP domain-containing sensor histidine kinase [Chthoniobacteraceae bacterium]